MIVNIFVLGIILLVSQAVQGWHGQFCSKPLSRLRWLHASSNQYPNSNSNSNHNNNYNYNRNNYKGSQKSSSENTESPSSNKYNHQNYNTYYRSHNNNNNNNNNANNDINIKPNPNAYNSYNSNNNNRPPTPSNYNNNPQNMNNNQLQQLRQPQPQVVPPSSSMNNNAQQPRPNNVVQRPTSGSTNQQGWGNEQRNSMSQFPRSEMPSRFDTCLMVVSGVIGTEPKEAYLANGHHVQSFALAVVGHFGAVHEGEKYKPTETMWVNCEMWDFKPESNTESPLRKGNQIHGVGYLLSNKWVDKTTGEEKKQFRVRIFKLINSDALYEYVDVIEDKGKVRGVLEIENGSYFSMEFPADADQTVPTASQSKEAAKKPNKDYSMMDDINQPLDVWDNFPPRKSPTVTPASSSSSSSSKSWRKSEMTSTWDSLEDEVEENNLRMFSE